MALFNENRRHLEKQRSRLPLSVAVDEKTNAGILRKKKRRRRKAGVSKGCMKGKGGPENLMCPYRGIRQRTWGKWVAEIRNPTVVFISDDDGSVKTTKQTGNRWLGTFSTAAEAAVAYDNAAIAIYGSNSAAAAAPILNFPERRRHVERAIVVEEDSVPDLGFDESDNCDFWRNLLERNGLLGPEENFAGDNVRFQNYNNLDEIKKMLLEEDEDEDEDEDDGFCLKESHNLDISEKHQNPNVEHRTMEKKNLQEETENSEKKKEEDKMGFGDEELDLLDEILKYESFEFSDILDMVDCDNKDS